jgi:hypothetical protein
MRWSVTIPGQPVSWDDAYITGKMPVKRRGVPVLNNDGSQKMIHRPILTDEARTWRDDVQLLVQNARPSRFKPTRQIRVVIDLYLSNDIDCDNATKLVFDGIERAFDKPFNDRQILPCYRRKEIVDERHARVELTFDDDPNAH